jgi:hypothetical protein
MKQVVHLLKGKVIICVCSAALLVAAIWVWGFIHSPVYSLSKIRSAVENHDFAKFEKYVDIDGFVTTGLTDLASLSANSQSFLSAGDIVGNLLGEQKETVFKFMHNMVKSFIERGRFDDKNTGNGIVSSILTQAQIPQFRLSGIDKVRREGQICRVSLNLHVDSYDGDAILELMMRNKGTYWQVAEMTNLSDFVQRLAELKRDYPAKNLLGTVEYFLENKKVNDDGDRYSKSRLVLQLNDYLIRAGRLDMVQKNIDNVINLAKNISWPSYRSIKADLLADASVQLYQIGKPERAYEVLNTLPAEEAYERSNGLKKIALEMAKHGKTDSAIIVIDDLKPDNFKVSAYAELSQQLHLKGIKDDNKKVIARMSSAVNKLAPQQKIGSLLELAGLLLSEKDTAQARSVFALVRNMGDSVPYYHNQHRVNILERIAYLSMSIGDSAQADSQVAKIQAVIDVEQSPYDKDMFKLSIALIRNSQGKKDDALALLDSVGSSELRARGISAIVAEMLRKKNFDNAIVMTNRVDPSRERDWLVGSISFSLASNKMYDRALDEARKIGDIDIRNSQFFSLALSGLDSLGAKDQRDLAGKIMHTVQ